VILTRKFFVVLILATFYSDQRILRILTTNVQHNHRISTLK